MENLQDLPVAKLVVTNSIDQTDRVQATGNMMDTIDIAPVIAESIRRTHNGLVSDLSYSARRNL